MSDESDLPPDADPSIGSMPRDVRALYRDMPLVMQLWNIYRSRAIGSWLQENEIKVIVNMRWGDERTYRISCEGVTRKCTIAVGTNGRSGTLKTGAIS